MGCPSGGSEGKARVRKEMSGDVWFVLVLNGLRLSVSVVFTMLKRWSWSTMASPRLLEDCNEPSGVVSIEAT